VDLEPVTECLQSGFIGAKDDGSGDDNRSSDVQSSSQIITANKPTTNFITGRMPVLSPKQQCQSIEGK